MASTHQSSALQRVDTLREVLGVAWDRARAFTPVPWLRPDTAVRRARSRSWWRRTLVVVLAVWMMPFQVLAVARQSSEVWVVPGASAWVARLDRSPIRRARGAAPAMVLAFAIAVVLLLGPVAMVMDQLGAGADVGLPAWLTAAGSVWFGGVLVLSMVLAVQTPAASRHSRLISYAKSLAPDGRGCVVAEVVATTPGSGSGTRLMRELKQGLSATGTVSVLYAATTDLADGFYGPIGWNADPAGDGRLMFRRSG